MSKNDHEKIEWLSIFGDCGQRLIEISELLHRYASCFYTTGNYKMGDSISELSEELEIIYENISRASGIVTSKMVKSSFQNSWNILQAALAGAKVAEESRKKEEKEHKMRV